MRTIGALYGAIRFIVRRNAENMWIGKDPPFAFGFGTSGSGAAAVRGDVSWRFPSWCVCNDYRQYPHDYRDLLRLQKYRDTMTRTRTKTKRANAIARCHARFASQALASLIITFPHAIKRTKDNINIIHLLLITTATNQIMGGIIDFGTTCPWEVYLFAFIHLLGGIFMYVFDSCRLLTSTSCNDAEKVLENMTALSLIYVGVIVRDH